MSGAESPWLLVREGGVELRVRVVPGSAADAVAGLYGDRLKVRIRAAPERGAANDALRRFLARLAAVPPAAVRIVAGEQNRSKTVLLSSTEPERTAARLRQAIDATVDSSRRRA